MFIRPANIADLPSIIALAADTSTSAQWPKEHYERAIQNTQPKRLILVLEDQSKILAFLVARAVAREWELENIAVASPRQGLGSLLMNEFLIMARQEQAEAIFLEVRESNSPARFFYEKSGFVITGHRLNYYADPKEAAIVYRRALS